MAQRAAKIAALFSPYMNQWRKYGESKEEHFLLSELWT